MPGIFAIEIINRLSKSKRSIEVYHHYTGIVDIIDLNQSITLPLRTTGIGAEPDYLLITIVKSTAPIMHNVLIDLPMCLKFEFQAGKEVNNFITHKQKRNIFNICPVSPLWKFKIWLPPGNFISSTNHVTISDE